MTGNGKIARLPHHIRNELNERIRNGEPGIRIVEWLNAHPEVKQTLHLWSIEQPINEQNLCNWKARRYQEWLRHQEACEYASQIVEQAEELETEADCMELSDRYAVVLSVELACAAKAMLDEITDPKERWQRIKEMNQELERLRRYDDKAARRRQGREDREKEEEQTKKSIEACKPFLPVLMMLLSASMGTAWLHAEKPVQNIMDDIAKTYLETSPPEINGKPGAGPSKSS